MITSLSIDLLVHTFEYLSPLELRAVAIVCKTFASVPTGYLWEAHFRQQWNQHNFILESSDTLILSEMLEKLYPLKSDCFRWLTHIVAPVPSYADIQHTNVLANLSRNHRIEPVAYDHNTRSRVMKMALDKDSVGGNRSVRANVPYEIGPHVQILPLSKGKWLVDIVRDGYFEITVQNNLMSNPLPNSLMCVVLGLGTKDFHVIGYQPGWDDQSLGYHSDDGRFFSHGTSRPFSSGFDVGDTIGCGIIRKENFTQVYFTQNGKRIEPEFTCPSTPLYPIVGLDAAFTITLNCGSFPFMYDPQYENDKDDIIMLQNAPWPQMKCRPSIWSNINMLYLPCAIAALYILLQINPQLYV
ncbi:hypothetical protein THRCLA_06120 [Thraustotheca clavata]|uniref:B30.2/SPRY domain-containing protein n=1 Tax=Thraustotheca clavata TaxID=74557 RepID=A0A1V9ZQF0_9STRA|nr:hypothetical protein THRCLA_06120 [Thraustotheca clavata]